MDISDIYVRPVYQPPPQRRVPPWVWVVSALGAFFFLVVVGIVTAVVIPIYLNSKSAVSASGERLCTALSAQDRRILLGGATGRPEQSRQTPDAPAGCGWLAEGAPAGGKVAVLTADSESFRGLLAQIAQGAQSVPGADPTKVARLSELAQTTVPSCDLFEQFEQVLGGQAGQPLVFASRVPESYGGGLAISGYTCRHDEIVGLVVNAETLDVGQESQDRVGAMLTLVAQRLD